MFIFKLRLRYNRWLMLCNWSFQFLPVAVVVIFVVASQCGKAAQADGIGEKDLSSSIHPNLRTAYHQTQKKLLYDMK